MTIRKPKTFWTCLVLFVIGVVIIVNIIRINIPDFTPLASFALLTGIGFIVAGYDVTARGYYRNGNAKWSWCYAERRYDRNKNREDWDVAKLCNVSISFI